VVDLKSPLRELALFAGAGGGILGGKLLGWQTVCAVEWEPYAACVLAARQNDGLLPPFPIWDDIQTFDGRPWRGIVDVVSGGFPCQDISVAGKGDGLDGERSGMWHQMARVVGEIRPSFVFVENSPMLTSRGGTRVIADLAALGYDTRWTVMGAADVGAPHQRDRFWLLAHSKCVGRQARPSKRTTHRNQEGTDYFGDSGGAVAHHNSIGQPWQQWQAKAGEASSIGGCGEIPNADQAGLQERDWRTTKRGAFATSIQCDWWNPEPDLGRVAHGVAGRVDRLKAIGNGQVPLCAAEAWRELSELL
jgi:DNA (cytosine-5)-methyltransferase 1